MKTKSICAMLTTLLLLAILIASASAIGDPQPDGSYDIGQDAYDRASASSKKIPDDLPSLNAFSPVPSGQAAYDRDLNETSYQWWMP